MRDYYEILGVDKGASESEIKRGYRKVAMKHHPDKNPGDSSAEAKFKEAAEAYSVLSDGDKKARYDQFGHAGVNQGAGGGQYSHMDINDIFSSFGDIFGGGGGFSDFFGGGQRRQRGGHQRGSDLKISLSLTYEEIFSGAAKTIKVKRMEQCGNCSGTGAKKGSQPVTCPSCEGQGEIRRVQRSFLGQVVNVQPCHHCNGRGQVVSNPCGSCRGNGRVKNTATVDIEIPAGVTKGNYMTQSGQGNVGGQGGPAGNLIIYFDEKDHSLLLRDGDDVQVNCWIHYPDAVLGTSIEVPTLSGKVQLKVPAGIKSGQVLRLRGKGFPILNRSRNGDQLVKINIITPVKYSKNTKKVIQELSKELGTEPEFNKFS